MDLKEETKSYLEGFKRGDLISIPFFLLISLLLFTGSTFIFGIKDTELTEIIFPSSPFAGFIVLWIALDPLLPKRLRLETLVQRTIGYIKKLVKGEE